MTVLKAPSANDERPKVLQLGHIENAHADVWTIITSQADVVAPPASLTRADFLRECRRGAFDGCVVAYRTYVFGSRNSPLPFLAMF